MMSRFNLATLLWPLFLFSVAFTPNKLPAAKPIIKTVHPITEDAELISWSPARKLLWDDFLCKPEEHSDAVASTSTTLGLAYQIVDSKLTYQIKCDFSKVKSWTMVSSPYILAHEQGHFDITEVCARNLYKTLQAYRFNPITYRQDINSIYENIINEKDKLQETYDDQTNHSRNKKLQAKWLKRISTMLAATTLYTNYP